MVCRIRVGVARADNEAPYGADSYPEEERPLNQLIDAACRNHGWTVRPATWNDIDRIVDLHNASFRSLVGADEITPQHVRSWFEWPGTDLDRDTRLVFDNGGRTIAWAALYDPEPPYVSNFYDIVVHPDVRANNALWGTLIDWCEARAVSCIQLAEKGVRVNGCARGDASDVHRDGALLRGGFHVTRTNTLMRIGLDAPIEKPAWPKGIRIQSFDLQRHLLRFAAAHQEAFRDHWGHVEQPLEAHAEELRREFTSWDDSFRSDLWFLAMDGSELAGATGIYPHIGGDYRRAYIYHVFVRRRWRGKGLAKALLRRAFREAVDRGYGSCELHVDSENFTGAGRLYEAVGMRAVRVTNLYEKQLRPGRDTVTRSLPDT